MPAKKKILKSKQFSLGTATAIFLSQTNMSTFKHARTFLLKSYLDVVIDDDEFILLCDESFLKKPKSPDEFFFIFTCNNDIKIQEYRNNTLNSSSATSMLLMPVSIPPVFFSSLFSVCSSVL